MSEILVVGSLAYDSVSTPSGKVSKALGGSANYFSLAASLFSKVRVVGVVGNDYEEKDVALLTSRGVDTAGMVVVDGKTFHWEGSYEGAMNEAITHKTELNVFEHFNPELPNNYRDSKFVFLANISPDLQMKVLNQVKNPLFVGMDTMNFWIMTRSSELKEVLRKVDVLLINEKEAMMLTETKNSVEAAKKVVELGPKYIVLKRGEYGFMLYSQEHGFFILPAFPIETVVDPTGAGDTFAGGFFGYLAGLDRKPTIQDLKKACLKGTVLASFTIQDFSVDQISKVTRLELDRRMTEYQKVIQHV